MLLCLYRQQLQQNTNQLAKESNQLVKDLGSLPLPTSPSEQVPPWMRAADRGNVPVFSFLFRFSARICGVRGFFPSEAAEDPEGAADERLHSCSWESAS